MTKRLTHDQAVDLASKVKGISPDYPWFRIVDHGARSGTASLGVKCYIEAMAFAHGREWARVDYMDEPDLPLTIEEAYRAIRSQFWNGPVTVD